MPEPSKDTLTVAYFSMEIGLISAMPTYSGGLGGLAGDTIRAAADMGIPMAAVTLLHRKGYFSQHLDNWGNQTESDTCWEPEDFLELLPQRVTVSIEGRPVQVQAWRYLAHGGSGHTIPVYLLDTSLPENSPSDRAITDHLYGGDQFYRLCQETVLGLGGVAMLRALGYHDIRAFHMNEGHSSLITLALLEEISGTCGTGVTDADREAIRQRCVFTTHTPVQAGHDCFPFDIVLRVLGRERANRLLQAGCCPNWILNMTSLALAFSRYVNGVSMRHEQVCRDIFCHQQEIDSITNGVHAATWVSSPFARLYDRHIPGWRHDNIYLRYAIGIPLEEVQEAHAAAKRNLCAEVERRSGVRLDPSVITIGVARRATPYKRTDLMFHDLARLREIARRAGPMQLVYAGKAHPRDEGGKVLIRHVFEAARLLRDAIPVVYLEEYDMDLARCLCSGVDVWLNTPEKPREASGTSGMKAALNGVPSLSILDGWWVEGHVEGITGWSIDDGWQQEPSAAKEVVSLYNKLENIILPMFYREPRSYANVMRSAIILNGSHFNAQRMMTQYLQNAYLRTGSNGAVRQETIIHQPANIQ